MLAAAALVQGFAGSARPSHASLGSARSAVSMATGNPIGAILDKMGIDVPGPDVSGLPPQVARAAESTLDSPCAGAHHQPPTHHSPRAARHYHASLSANRPPLTAHRAPRAPRRAP